MPLLTTLGSSSALSYGRTVQKLLTFIPASLNEGSVGTLTASNLNDGTYYWTILNNTSADTDWAAVSGSFTVTGSVGTFNVTPILDYTTEGTETFQVQVREGSTSGTVLLTSKLISILDISIPPTITLTRSTTTESQFDFPSVSNLGPAGTYYWTIDHITSSDDDFNGATSGSFVTTTTNETGNFFGFFLKQDYLTEGTETFRVSVRTGSTSGPAIVTSNIVTITDTSLNQSATITPTATSGTEGTTFTFNFSTSGVPTGSQLTWNVINGSTTNADFSAVTGIVNSGFGSGSFTVTTVTGDGAEADETFQVELLGSIGQRIGLSTTVTILTNAT